MTDASLNAEDLPSNQGAISTKMVLEALSALCDKIARIVEEGKSDGVLRSTQEIYNRFSIERGAFEETPLGLKRVDFTPEEFSKESWFQATRTVVWRLQESDDYLHISDMLRRTDLKTERAKRLLDSFAHRVSYRLLETHVTSERNQFLTEQFEAVRKHLDGDRFRHTSEVRVLGFAAPPLPIEFTASEVDVHLRRIAPEDLLEEGSSFFGRDRFPPTPSAILRLSKVVQYENEVQKGVWQAMTILRLFKVGSVRELSYTNESDSYFALGGTHINHQHYSVVTTCVLEEPEQGQFEQFWKAMSAALPKEGYGHINERIDPVYIAYNRYSDSLLSWGASVERRISDAVIGLESIFLMEDDELSYRLRLRVAKLLTVVGFNPQLIMAVIRVAYEVRSSFLHGSHVNKKTLGKVDREYGGLDNVLLHVLDYLRCSIVIVTLKALLKNELIDRIDASFVDDNTWHLLQEQLEDARPHIVQSIH